MNDKTITLQKEKSPEKVYVRTVQGEMVHLFTNERLTTKPTRVVKDDFINAQIEAGKLIVGEE